MPRTALALLLVPLASCASPGEPSVARAWRGDVQRWGTLREALHDGKTEARVELDEVARPGIYGVGALEGLRGEVTIEDGEVWISENGPSGPVTTRGSAGGARATVLFAAEVSAWRDVVLAADVAPAELDAFLEREARASGLDADRPFPFVVAGELRDVRLHVIGGECPLRARIQGREMASPAYELERASAEGRLVGLYAAGTPGIYCSHGSQTHVHALLEAGGPLTGHVEAVGLAAGAVLRLPAGS